jgi:hypothetical protein
MNGRRLNVSVMFVVLASTTISSVYAGDIRVDVTAGKHEVTDWVAEATLNLVAAAKLWVKRGARTTWRSLSFRPPTPAS